MTLIFNHNFSRYAQASRCSPLLTVPPHAVCDSSFSFRYSIPVATQEQFDHQTATQSWKSTSVFQPSYAMGQPTLPGIRSPVSSPDEENIPVYQDRDTAERAAKHSDQKSNSPSGFGFPRPLLISPYSVGATEETDLMLGIGLHDTPSPCSTDPADETALSSSEECLEFSHDYEPEQEQGQELDERHSSSSSSSLSLSSVWTDRLNLIRSSVSSMPTPTLSTPGTLTPTASNHSLATTPTLPSPGVGLPDSFSPASHLHKKEVGLAQPTVMGPLRDEWQGSYFV